MPRSKKQLSDTIRDKIVKAREQNPDKRMDELEIVITDEEASDIWSSLSDVEAETHNIKRDLLKTIKKGFSQVENLLGIQKLK